MADTISLKRDGEMMNLTYKIYCLAQTNGIKPHIKLRAQISGESSGEINPDIE